MVGALLGIWAHFRPGETVVATPVVPEFRRSMSQGRSGQVLVDFVYTHDASIVYLDLLAQDASNSTNYRLNIDPWNGQPSSTGNGLLTLRLCTNCQPVELHVVDPPEDSLGYVQGEFYLKGYFTVTTLRAGDCIVILTGVDTANVRPVGRPELDSSSTCSQTSLARSHPSAP